MYLLFGPLSCKAVVLEWEYLIWFIHSALCGHLGWFQLLAMVQKGTLSIVLVFLWLYVLIFLDIFLGVGSLAQGLGVRL